jgi:putative transposase
MNLPLEPDKMYYLFHQSAGKDSLFYSDENYLSFLKCYADMLVPIADTYAYCLLPNQFHYLVKIKSEKIIFDFLKKQNRIPEENLSFEEYKNLALNTSSLVGNIFSLQLNKQFTNFLNSYQQILTTEQNKKHQLLIQSTKRTLIENDEQFLDTLINIHCSPNDSSTRVDYTKWKFSSYAAYLSERASAINREVALDLFQGRDNFIAEHNKKMEQISMQLLEQSGK